MWFNITLPNGTGGRWAIGVIVLIHLVAYHETGGPAALIATGLAAINAYFSAICKSGVKHIQIPYLRTSHRFDFLCLYLALWMDILTLLSACGALARTLSTCLDAMTGGLARMWILGRNSPVNEPWPDVLGVAVIFLVTGMFMLGLENTKVFSFLMISGVLGITGILSGVTVIRGNTSAWHKNILPTNIPGLIVGTALNIFAYPSELPSTGNYKRLKGLLNMFIVFITSGITAICLSMLIEYSANGEFTAVPILPLLEIKDFHKMIPAVACLLVLSCSGALLELYPEMYNIIVRLTTSEWRILLKQIGYENRESGSPILAVFTGGSLCAMLAFACPLENLIYILSASYLCSGILRAFYLLYSPFRPKYIHQQNDCSLGYSRLDATIVHHNPPNLPGCSNINSSNSSIIINSHTASNIQRIKNKLFFNKKNNTLTNRKVNIKSKKSFNGEEIEKEWLLLGEPPSPKQLINPNNNRTDINQQQETNVINIPEGEHQHPQHINESDTECIVKGDATDNDNSDETDSSTDIDAIVDEYRQKIKVFTAGPMDKQIKIPTRLTWYLSILFIFIIFVGILLITIGVLLTINLYTINGFILIIIIYLIMLLLPKCSQSQTIPTTLTCIITLLIHFLLLITTLNNSWPAIIFWLLAGIMFFIRCDTFCCLCLDTATITNGNNNKTILQHQLIPNVSSKLNTKLPRTIQKASIVNGHGSAIQR